jgi:hypothetical protein
LPNLINIHICHNFKDFSHQTAHENKKNNFEELLFHILWNIICIADRFHLKEVKTWYKEVKEMLKCIITKVQVNRSMHLTIISNKIYFRDSTHSFVLYTIIHFRSLSLDSFFGIQCWKITSLYHTVYVHKIFKLLIVNMNYTQRTWRHYDGFQLYHMFNSTEMILTAELCEQRNCHKFVMHSLWIFWVFCILICIHIQGITVNQLFRY